MSEIYTRHTGVNEVVRDIYTDAFDNKEAKPAYQAIRQFRTEPAKNPVLYLAKLGQDGHDRAKIIASAFADFGYNAIAGNLFETPEEAADSAISNDVNVIEFLSLAAGHKT